MSSFPTLVSTDLWVALTASYDYDCAVRADGTLHCRGWGRCGGLGHGDVWRLNPTEVGP